MKKQGNIALEINAEVIKGPRGMSIQKLKYKETLSNGDNVYEIIREDNIVIGEIIAKKGEQGIQGVQGETGRGIVEVKKVEKIDKTNNWEIKYTTGESDFIAIQDGDSAFEVAVENGFTWEWAGEGEEPEDYGMKEWLLSLVGRGLEFNWEENKLGVRVEGETEYQYSDNLKGEKGDRGDIGPGNILSVGNVEKGEQAQVIINGESPEQVLNFVLPKGDKGDIGEKGEQGEQGRKGNGIVRTQFVREDNEKVYYKFIYDDGSEFQWSTWKGEAGISGTGATAGDIVETLTRTVETPEDWLSLENYRPIYRENYPELEGKVKWKYEKWERLNPQITSDNNNEDFKVEMRYFDSYNSQVPVKTDMDITPLIDAINGGTQKDNNYVNFPFSSSIPQEQPNNIPYPLIIKFSGKLVEEAIRNNDKILCIFHVRINAWARNTDDFMIWQWFDTSTGYYNLVNNMQLARASENVYIQTEEQDKNKYYDLYGMQMNTMQYPQGYLDNYMQTGNGEKDTTAIGIEIGTNNNCLNMEVFKIELWRKTPTNFETADIAPYFFLQFPPYWTQNVGVSDMANWIQNFPVEQNLKRQIYLGKKVETL